MLVECHNKDLRWYVLITEVRARQEMGIRRMAGTSLISLAVGEEGGGGIVWADLFPCVRYAEQTTCFIPAIL